MKNYILIITMHADPAMPPGYGECGGTQTYMKELLDELGKRNIPCIMVTRKSMQYLPSEEQYNTSCKIIRLLNGDDEPMSKLLLHHYHDINLKEIAKLIRLQESLPLAIHSVYWNSGRLAMALSSEFHVPFVHSVISNSRGRVSRGADEPLEMRAQYEQEIYEHAEKILCVSEDEKYDLEKFYKIPPEKLVVCGQYVDMSFLYPPHDTNGFPNMNSRISEDVQEMIADKYNDVLMYEGKASYWIYKAFTYFGRLDFNKGLLQILQAWYICYNIYHECCPPLWIIGGSLTDISKVRKRTLLFIPELSDLEKTYKIIWWGYLTPQGLSTLLLKTQTVLMHSLYEPGGRVAVEAMCEGVPVIATPYGFAKDSIRDWENGFLINYGDVNALAQRMEHFIRQPFLNNVLGQNARQCGKEILKGWNFIGNHLKAYGLSESYKYNHDLGQFRSTKETKYSVKVFPYCTAKLTDQYIKDSFSTFCTEKPLSINTVNTDDGAEYKLIITPQNRYIVKQTIAKLSMAPLYNPIAEGQFVLDPEAQFNIELNMYQKTNSKSFLGSDAFHHLIYLHEPVWPVYRQDEMLIQCLQYICRNNNPISELERKDFIRIITQPFADVASVKIIWEQLAELFPRYYFSPSGEFAETAAWNLVPFLLSYNKHLLATRLYMKLNDIYEYFSAIQCPLESQRLQVIFPALSPRHFCLIDNNLDIFSYDQVAIGNLETEVASLIFEYYKTTSETEFFDAWDKKILLELISLNLNISSVISSFTYRLLRDTIMITVIERKDTERYLNSLDLMKERMENIKV